MLGTVDYPIRFAETQFPLPPRTEDLFSTAEAVPRTGNLVQALEAWGAWVLEKVRPKLAPYYPSEAGETVIAYFWAKTARCANPTCGAEIPLVAHRWLSKRKRKHPVAFRLLPQPDRTLQVEVPTFWAENGLDGYQFSFTVEAIPEPATLAGLLLGVWIIARRR